MNNSENVGNIAYDMRIDTSKLKSDARSGSAIVTSEAQKTSKDVENSNRQMSGSFGNVAESVIGVAAAYQSLQTMKDFLSESVGAANQYQAALLGLGSISTAYGQDAAKATQAARNLAQDGLMSVSDAATGLKNLLASGFSLDQAIVLMNRFKDSAAFGRQSALGFGESIRGATEGIKNGNSILTDNAGVTKNLSVILEQAGKSQQDVMNITTDASVRQALYNGLLRETNATLGDSSRLSQTAAGADSAFTTELTYLQVAVGNVANAIRQPLVEGLTQFISANQTSIISVGAGIGTFIAFAGGAYIAVKAVETLKVALLLLARSPLGIFVTIAGALVGILAGSVMDEMQKNLQGTADGADDLGKGMGNASDGMSKASKEAEKLAKQLRSIDEQIDKTNRNYKEQLADIVQSSQKNIADITRQLNDEKAKYNKAYADRLYDFNQEQGKEQESHADKVLKLQAQIDFLRRYNNASNQQQLSELQFALAQENSQYDQKYGERKSKYDQDAAAELDSYNKRAADLQLKLTAEKNLLAKHAADVASIRGMTLLDEIDKLKRSRNEQLASLNQQKLDALQNASSTASGIGGTYDQLGKDLKKSMKGTGESVGKGMGDAFVKALQDALKKMWDDLVNFANHNPFQQWLSEKGKEFGQFANHNDFQKFFSDAGKSFGQWISGHRASGGPVSSGQAYIVGDNPDGSLNRTSEAFIPNTSGTIVSSGQLQKALGNTGGAQYITLKLDVSGIMTSSPAEERALAKRIIERFNEGLRAKGIKEIGVAV